MKQVYRIHGMAFILGMLDIPLFWVGFDLVFRGATVPGVLLMYGPILLSLVFILAMIFIPMIKPMNVDLARHFRQSLLTFLVGVAFGYFITTIGLNQVL